MSAFQPPAAVGSADNNSPGTAQNPNQTAARNPKKRSRASRRAPTTVLTTDTTNFRAMVQEFTVFPPRLSTVHLSRTRLDLFGTRSSALDAAQPPPPPYLRRPFPQKVQSPPPPPSFLASSSSSLLNSTTNNINIFSSVPSTSSSSASSSTTPVNYQLPITQSPNLFNIPNPLLTSLLQTNPKFLFSSSSAMAAKPLQGSFDLQIPSNNIKIGGLEEFSLGPGNHVSATLSDLPNLISTDPIGARNNDRDDHHNTDNNNAGTWRNNGVNRHDEGDDYQAQIRPVNGGNYNNGKINYTASSSDFHGEKGPENVATRGEGMVESWICSSE
ncbi:UNVERIFIED_CONTAM: hypothetical protein Sradi_0822000 [Sesamum radiatum]|uniref:VQ domain-containing protein n=1 Tax=Sesamum radiatum TaxID=300843 RepID=A0AAW2VT37_SESRA